MLPEDEELELKKPPELLLEDEEDVLTNLPELLLEDDEIIKEPDELLLEEEPFKMSWPSCGADAKDDSSILVPGENFPKAFINLS